MKNLKPLGSRIVAKTLPYSPSGPVCKAEVLATGVEVSGVYVGNHIYFTNCFYITVASETFAIIEESNVLAVEEESEDI